MHNKYLYWSDDQTIKKLSESLKKNMTSVVSTDTVLGLLANVSESGFEELNKIKKRYVKPYIILIDSPRKLFHFIEDNLDDQVKNLINKCWPGPVTIIFKSKKNINFYLKSSDDTIAIRIPKHESLLKLLGSFEGLFSTSANIAGQKIPENIKDLDPSIIDSSEYIVLNKDSKNTECNEYSVIPSTILDCTGPKIKLVREGIYRVKDLEELYGEAFIRSST